MPALLGASEKKVIKDAIKEMGKWDEFNQHRAELKALGMNANEAILRAAQKFMPAIWGPYGGEIPRTRQPGDPWVDGDEPPPDRPSRAVVKRVRRGKKQDQNEPDWNRLNLEAGDSVNVRACADWAAANMGNREAAKPPGPMAVAWLQVAFKDKKGFLDSYQKLSAKDEASMASTAQTRKTLGLIDDLLKRCDAEPVRESSEGPQGQP